MADRGDPMTVSEQVFLLPDLGEGLTEADILEWKVAVGDTVDVDQVIAEVETAKAAVEVPCPFAGTVLRLHGEVGQQIGVGEPLITVAPLDGGSGPHATPVEHPDHQRYREEERAGSGNVLIGYGTSPEAPRRQRRKRAGAAPDSAKRVVAPDAPVPLPGRVISPIVRRLAVGNGIDITTLRGSGPAGLVLRADVEAAIASPQRRRADAAVRVPLTGVRRVIADKLTLSRREIPDATTWVDADVTLLMQTRAAINRSRAPEEGVGLLALVARLCLAALRQYPELNSSVDLEREEIVRHPSINLGIAAQTPRGLVVPVIEGADALTAAALSAEITQITALARDGKLPPARMTGGTFTLNNYGVFGVDGSTPIINHPEAAILGIGRIIDRPWVVGGELTVRKVAQLSLSFDHRVCDGGTAGGFLRTFADFVENPAAALGVL